MPTVMGPRFDSDYPRIPPRMSELDLQLYKRWITLHRLEIKSLFFDVGLGEGYPAGTETDPELIAMWLKNTQKRADVIAVTQEEVWITELRWEATENAIGRLLLYFLLWMDDPSIVAPVKLRLVSNRDDPDVRRLANIHNIIYEIL